MKLVRLALINFDSKQSEPTVSGVFAGDDGVSVHVTRVAEPVGNRRGAQLIVKATTALAGVDLDAERFIVIPEAPRLRCEAAIMRIADLHSVSMRCRRLILSGTPPAALIAETGCHHDRRKREGNRSTRQ